MNRRIVQGSQRRGGIPGIGFSNILDDRAVYCGDTAVYPGMQSVLSGDMRFIFIFGCPGGRRIFPPL
jgi:hypothetical protein